VDRGVEGIHVAVQDAARRWAFGHEESLHLIYVSRTPVSVPVHARSLRPRERIAPILWRRSPRLLAAGGRGDQPSPAGGRGPQATAATTTAAAVGRLPPLAISGRKHFSRQNVVPKSPKMARPQDALSSYSPRLLGAEAGGRARPRAPLLLDGPQFQSRRPGVRPAGGIEGRGYQDLAGSVDCAPLGGRDHFLMATTSFMWSMTWRVTSLASPSISASPGP